MHPLREADRRISFCSSVSSNEIIFPSRLLGSITHEKQYSYVPFLGRGYADETRQVKAPDRLLCPSALPALARPGGTR
jgi:hypothetical protein